MKSYITTLSYIIIGYNTLYFYFNIYTIVLYESYFFILIITITLGDFILPEKGYQSLMWTAISNLRMIMLRPYRLNDINCYL